MARRGPKPKGHVKIKWSSGFVYAIGLLVTDGSLSKDGRHIDFTSTEIEQIENFKKCLALKVGIGRKHTGGRRRVAYRVQFGDVLFYNFLMKIGLMPNKTKILREINIPNKYFHDFLRGHLDGDGSFYSYWDKRWKSSFMFYLTFISASEMHISWLREKIFQLLKVQSNVNESNGIFRLRYAKRDSLRILKYIYPTSDVVCLSRKRLKIENALATMDLYLS